MLKFIFTLSVTAITFFSFAQKDEAAVKYAETITFHDLTRHLLVIAGDEMEGREAGKPGQKLAAAYIATHFEKLGFPKIGTDKTYFQRFLLVEEKWGSVKIEVNDQEFTFLTDFYGFSRSNPVAEIKDEDITFIGYGIDDKKYSDYAAEKEKNIKGKILLMLDGEPQNEKGIYLTTGTKEPSGWSTNWRNKLQTAQKYGAKAVLIIKDDFKESLHRSRHWATSSSLRLKNAKETDYPVNFSISPEMADKILESAGKTVTDLREKISKKEKPYTFQFSADSKIKVEKELSTVGTENVVAFIEGTDLKDEVIVLTAHYDHVGANENEIYNGADDDGSGTVALMEIAEALAKAKEAGNGPRRSVLVMLVSAEEKGLLGSKYYVENPLFPLKNTVANLNVDMIGRVDEAHEDNPEYLYVIGSNFLSTELHEINENANRTYSNIELDYTYNKIDDPNRFYFRSDHYNFAKNNIPVIFYFNGTHEDYHRPSDTVEKINFDVLEKRTRHIFYTLWELANRNERIKVDVKQ